MTGAAIGLLGPASAGLAAMPFGAAALPGAGMAALLAAGLFVALLGLFAAAPEAERRSWSDQVSRRGAALCAAAFGAAGALAGVVAWEVWHAQGPTRALGLVAAALAFASAALGFGRRALRG